jgi:rhodanese-related sulfurtransferase
VTLGELFDGARARIERLEPPEASAAAAAGALIVDIRSESSRERAGVVPGSLHVPRTVLEWRFEPGGRWRNPHVGDLERRVIVLCDHGYASVFAAAMLVQLGYGRACDVVGGFEAWHAAGLPVVAAPERREGELPGMGGPD